MSHHLSTALVAVTIATALGPARPASGFSHRGTVVDASTKKPIPDVLAVAATSNKLVEKGDCPKYDGFVGQATSKPDGSFTLRIAETVRAYFITYCRAHYEILTPLEQNENTKDGDVIIPVPIRLWPLNGGAMAMRNALTFLRDDTKAAVLALQHADPITFAAAVKLLPDPEQRLIEAWMTNAAAHDETSHDAIAGMTPVLVVRQLTPMTLADLTTKLHRALASERITLSYFETASPDHFRAQLNNFPDLQGYLHPHADEPKTHHPSRSEPTPTLQEPPPVLPQLQCGSPRELVGAAADNAVNKIALLLTRTSITELLDIQPPHNLSSTTPRTPPESRIFSLRARVEKSVMTRNGDIRLVLTDVNGEQLIAVIPHDCVEHSRFAAEIEQVRSLLLKVPPRHGDIIVLDGLAFFPLNAIPRSGDLTRIELRPVLKLTHCFPRWDFPQWDLCYPDLRNRDQPR